MVKSGYFATFGNFLKNVLITFFLCVQIFGDDIDQLAGDGFD